MAANRKSARARNNPQKRPSIIETVGRAIALFRQGAQVAITDRRGRAVVALAVETATDKALAALKKTAAPASTEPLSLVLTHERANTLKIRLYTPLIVALPLAKKATAAELRSIADPVGDLDSPLKGPFETTRTQLPETFAASVKLAKLAELLPSAIIQPRPRGQGLFSLRAADIFAYDAEVARTLAIVARARVPLEGAEKTEMVAFRSRDGGPEHYAIVIGAPSTHSPVLTRMHSGCFTGDLLHSLKCDCGDQLRGAIQTISQTGGGVLLYLQQEGRGIGLINKLRAYSLQNQGFDTVEANLRLGFEADERLYGIAARMLSLLGYRAIRLLTNNPDKVEQLKGEGVNVVERVPHAFPDNEHNRAYLQTKAAKAGHYL